MNPEKIARASSKRPWVVIGVWLAVLLLAFGLSGAFLADALTTDFDFTDNPESKRAQVLVEERLEPGKGGGPDIFSEFLVVSSASTSVADPAFESYVGELITAAAELGPDKIQGVFPVGANGLAIVSEDGQQLVVTVLLANTELDEASTDAEELVQAVHQVEAPAGMTARLFGFGTSNNDYTELAEEALAKGEFIGVAVALVVLLVVIGAAVAAGIPILLAIAAIASAIGMTALVGKAFALSFFVVNFITMMGLAVGIDYSLFIVARYREERVRGYQKLEAIGRAGATANRAVFFSGMTVVLALFGLLFLPNTIFRSLAVGAILVVILAVAASMTLLPAVLSLLGDRINLGRVRKKESLRNVDKVGGMWDRITEAVMAKPLVWLIGGAGLLLLLGSFGLRMNTGFAGASTLPDRLETKQAFDILVEDFGLGGVGQPVEILVDGPIDDGVQSALADLQAAMSSNRIFGPPDPVVVNDAGDLALLSVPLSGDIQSEVSTAAVENLRAELVPEAFARTSVDVLVGGFTAFTIDFFDDVDTFTPIVFIFILGLSFLLLTVVFRSVVLPVKAIILNLLSVAAAYGMVVLFFQAGVGPDWIKGLFGFLEVESIEAWLPLFLFAVLFGLSMDYHVFLLTRIREHFDRTGDNALSVAHGLRTTGAIITGAALIMVAVFGGFAAGELVFLQQMGFGLAVAVFLDATVVRSVLVPASMRLLGDWNWYLPKWLDWLPKIDIEGHEAAAEGASHQAAAVAGTVGVE
ncbi:MAG: MMPL family transporter [Acidimicrobiia bacterium]|nr:MMPL family transporter [Acidimicrobiia bacterium]